MLLMLAFVSSTQAQFLWYENETNTNHLEYSKTSSGTFFTNVENPDTSGINANASVAKFNRNEGVKAFLDFNLYKPITNLTGFSITIKAYLDIPTEELTTVNKRFRMYVSSSSVNGAIYKQLNFTAGQKWESFTFEFDGEAISEALSNSGGFDQIKIGFANSNTSLPAASYYLDSISGTTEQTRPAASWMAGSWGVTFPVFGGERLDAEVAGGYDLLGGAQEIVAELPAVGHVITNLSYFAHSYYFPLRENRYVDVANEIHSSIVPSVENGEIIYEVLQTFKDANKKVILYISTNYFERASNEVKNAWLDYYTAKFAGDEYAAYENLIKGFVEQVKNYADGYWLDTTSSLANDGKLDDFILMLKETDPGAAVSANYQKNYFVDENEAFIYVDSDGIDDEDPTDYKIVLHEPLNAFQDFTNGHVTPLGQGAPPNSFGYEEYTLPNMAAEPWFNFEGKDVLKHAWFPIRERWHVPTQDLVFETEQAYRYVRTVVDGNASITFANTTDDGLVKAGYMMADEMAIMKEINTRLLSNPIPNYEPYVRPEGAYLLGEENLEVQSFPTKKVHIYPNPVVHEVSLTKSIAAAYTVHLISVTGVSVLKTTWSGAELTKKLDVSHLTSGIYFLKLSDEKNLDSIRKIIITQ